MFQLDLKSRKSIYEQVVDHLKELIISGVLQAEEKLPSVRELSKTLTVNPNTIQKAYRELERQGYVYTSPGLGTFVADRSRAEAGPEEIARAVNLMRDIITEMLYVGIPLSKIREIIDTVLAEKENWK